MDRFGNDSKPYPVPNVSVSKARFSFDMVGSGEHAPPWKRACQKGRALPKSR